MCTHTYSAHISTRTPQIPITYLHIYSCVSSHLRCFSPTLNTDILHKQHVPPSSAFSTAVPPFWRGKRLSEAIFKWKVLLHLSGKQFALRICLTSLPTPSTYCKVLKYKLNEIFSSTGNQCISFLIAISFLSFEYLADKTMSQGQFYILQLTILITATL